MGNQRLTPPSSVISAPLKDGRMGLRVPATMDDELEDKNKNSNRAFGSRSYSKLEHSTRQKYTAFGEKWQTITNKINALLL